MIIEYTPEGGEAQRFDTSRLRTSEIQIAERTADRPWADLRNSLKDGDVTAMRTLAWVIKKRDDPSLRFTQFDPFENELGVLLDVREVRLYAEQIMKTFGDNADELADAWAELRSVAADKEAAEVAIAEQADGPKEPADESPTSTSSD